MEKEKASHKNWKNLKFLYQFSWNINPKIFFISIFKIVYQTLTPFVFLIFPKYILDEITNLRRWNMVLLYALYMAISMAILKGIEILSQVFVNMTLNLIDTQNANYFIKELGNAEYMAMEDGTKRDRMVLFGINLNPNIIINEGLAGIVIAIFQLIGYSYILTTLNPLIIGIILLLTILHYFAEKLRQKQKFIWKPTESKFSRRLEYLFSLLLNPKYAKETRINGITEWVDSRFQIELSVYRKEHTKFEWKWAVISTLNYFISFVQMIVSYGWAAFQAVAGNITIGSFMMYSGAAYGLAEALNTFMARIAEQKQTLQYVPQYQEYRQEIAPRGLEKETEDIPKAPYTIQFEDVSFQYPAQDSFALEHVSFTITDGEKLALVGLNGAGKTTFVKLLCRLYQPTSGKITINGIDIQTMHRQKYMELLSVVFQDFQLLAFPLWENIVLDREREERQLLQALEQSGFSSRISTLEKGMETYITKEFDEAGVDFSGGEQQKLALARAIYKDAPIVILDEPASALDPVAEYELYHKFNEIASGKTAIYISHRLSFTNFCDRVAVFRAGKIEECGTHQELLEKKGLYAELYYKQAQYYIKEEELVQDKVF